MGRSGFLGLMLVFIFTDSALFFPGYCCIEYSVCTDTNGFTLSTMIGAMMVLLDEACATLDYVSIEGTRTKGAFT